jgi:transposase
MGVVQKHTTDRRIKMITEYYTTIGMDVSDRKIQVCVMTKSGVNPKIVTETTIPTTKEGVQKFLSTQDKNTPVVFETGMHCRWMHEIGEGMGFKVYVANPCRLKMITESKTKNDVNDARMLARIALSDPGLLHPVKLRDAEHQKMLNLHEIRNLLIKQRTGMIVQMRFIAKSMGFRIPKTSTRCFHKLDTTLWPKEFRDIAWPMLKNLEQLDITIKTYEKKIRELAETPTFKAQVDRLMEIHYVGLYAATGFIAVTGGDMDRFERPRDIGPWLGLSPKQDQSGDIDKQCHITKAGSPLMRRLLVECAQMIVRDGAIETDLKIKGMRICVRGAKIAKRKAITAVARSLAVLMVAMLKKMDKPYKPLSEVNEKAFSESQFSA